MITEETRQQILDEELYRAKIRKELSCKDNSENKLWTFLNSGFGIWLLSTVVIGLISFGYTKMNEKFEVKENSKKELKILNIELFERVKAYKSSLSKVRTIAEYTTANFLFLSDTQHRFIQTELKDKNFKELLIELESLDEDKKDEVKKAMEGFDEINKIVITRAMSTGDSMNPIGSEYVNNIRSILDILSKSFSRIN